jgi:type I restriction enzyme S subunit
MNTTWRQCTIGDVCDTISNTYNSNAQQVVLINTSDVLEGKVLNHIYIPNENLKGQFKKTFEEGDILYSEIRPQNKRYAYIDFAPINYIASTKLMVIRNKNIVKSKYLYYFLQSDKIISELQMLAETRSGTFPQITFNELSKLSIKIPPLPEQDRIISILDSICKKIDINQQINDNLEEQAKALFKSWFVDFEPFKGGKFVDSELGLIPKGWSTGTIYSYIDVIYGAPYKSALFNDKKQGLPLIRIRDLKTYTPQYYTKEVLPNTEYVECGDIIAGMDAEFIPHIWRGEKGVLNQRLCKFVPKYDYVSKYYIYSLVYPKLAFVQSYKVGTTVSHLGKADIDRFKVIVPPEDIIMQYSKIVNSYFAEIVKVSNENQILSSLRDTLLPKLMSGELSVEEVSLD